MYVTDGPGYHPREQAGGVPLRTGALLLLLVGLLAASYDSLNSSAPTFAANPQAQTAAGASASVGAPQNCTDAIQKALGNIQDPPAPGFDNDKSTTLDACFGAVVKEGKTPSQNPSDYQCVGRSGQVTVGSTVRTMTNPDPGVPMGHCEMKVCEGGTCGAATLYGSGDTVSLPAPANSTAAAVAQVPVPGSGTAAPWQPLPPSALPTAEQVNFAFAQAQNEPLSFSPYTQDTNGITVTPTSPGDLTSILAAQPSLLPNTTDFASNASVLSPQAPEGAQPVPFVNQYGQMTPDNTFSSANADASPKPGDTVTVPVPPQRPNPGQDLTTAAPVAPKTPGNPGGAGNGTGSGSGSGSSSGLSSLLSGLAKGLAQALGAPQAPAAAPAAACSTDPNTYAQQQQQYQQQLQNYNTQLQQYNYQLQLNQYYAQQGQVAPAAPTPPQQPTPCSPSTQQQCAIQPSQPAASSCSTGNWQPVYSGNCIVNWQCSDLGAQLSCSPSTADVGATLAFTYACAQGIPSGSGFTVADPTQLSGAATTTVAAPPVGTNTATYSLTCTNGSQISGAQCSVQVNQPSIVLVANPATVSSGQTSQIGWVTSGMQACVISSPKDANFTAQNANNTSVSGTAQTSALTAASNEFDLTCLTLGGQTKTASTIVTVPGGTVSTSTSSIVTTSSADGATLNHGDTVTINWLSSGEPSDAAVSLWVFDPSLNAPTALITSAQSLNGNFTWTVPAAGSTCPTDGSYNVCGADLVAGHQYAVEADVYTPADAYVGDGPPPANPVQPTYGDYSDAAVFTVGQ